jgi:Sodium:sulfate symporter transmembrane region
VPGVLAALVLAFLSNLFGSITHYGSGQVRSHYSVMPTLTSLACRCWLSRNSRGPGASATRPWRRLLLIESTSSSSTFQGAVYIGSGYLALPDVFKYGALFSVINLTLWSVVGVFWWKALGLY